MELGFVIQNHQFSISPQYVMSVWCQGRRTVHQELCHSLAELLQPSSTDQLTTTSVLRYAHSFFAFVARSMALHLLTTARIKVIFVGGRTVPMLLQKLTIFSSRQVAQPEATLPATDLT